MTTPDVFSYQDRQVRTVTVDGEPWFVAADVCEILDLERAHDSVRYLEDDERDVIDVSAGQYTGFSNHRSPNPRVHIVNEPGLYSLILRSRKPEAREFKRWVTHEVLPQIRRTGSYATPEQPEVPQTYVAALRELADTTEAKQAAEARAAELEGPAHSWTVLASGRGDYSVADAAKVLTRDPAISIGRDRLFEKMRQLVWVYRAKADGRWRAYQAQVDRGRISELPQHYENARTGELTLGAPQVRVTVKGLRELHRRLGGTAELDLSEQLSLTGGTP